MNKCNNCQKATKNPKYCSKSCAAIINNKNSPKRKLEEHNKCLLCKKKLSRRIGSRTHQLCQKCFTAESILKYGKKTKEELVKTSSSYSSKHRYELIRQHAKRLACKFEWKKDFCENCGYTKHVELCHIKPIHDFPDSSLVNEINNKTNICFLCPNCHWELDNKYKLEILDSN